MDADIIGEISLFSFGRFCEQCAKQANSCGNVLWALLVLDSKTQPGLFFPCVYADALLTQCSDAKKVVLANIVPEVRHTNDSASIIFFKKLAVLYTLPFLDIRNSAMQKNLNLT